jgi:hypothetical protein
MLRPQVFALQEGEVQIGLICSEKQAIDATLIALEREDPRFGPIADKYWNARGGSYTDGGSFIFSLKDTTDGMKLICTDKFGKVIKTPQGKSTCDVAKKITVTEDFKPIEGKIASLFAENDCSAVADKLFAYVKDSIGGFNPDKLRFCIETIKGYIVKSDDCRQAVINALTLMNDLRFNTGSIKRSSLQHVLKIALDDIFDTSPIITEASPSRFSRINYAQRDKLRAPKNNEKILVIDAEQFEPEG